MSAWGKTLELYGGWIGPNGAKLYGRYYVGDPIQFAKSRQDPLGWIADAKLNIESLAARPGVPGARITINLTDGQGHSKEFPCTTDATGHICVSQDQGAKCEPSLDQLAGPWSGSQVTVGAHVNRAISFLRSIEAKPISIPVFDSSHRVGAISDIDDTIIATDVLHTSELIKHSIFKDPFTVKSFAGTAKVLSTVYARGANPVFYVSGSPWGFYERTAKKLQLDHFPSYTTLVLKRLDLSEPLTDQIAYKVPHILGIMASMPNVEWLLFGDSGEFDPEVYRNVHWQYPDRVKGIFIHFVTDDQANKVREVKLENGTRASYPLDDPNSDRFMLTTPKGQTKRMFVFRNWSELPADMQTTGDMRTNPGIERLATAPPHDELWGKILLMEP